MNEITFPNLVVPANSSRHFLEYAEAINQPVGQLKIEYSEKDKFFYNANFDQSLILHDSSYCTKDDFHMDETKGYFFDLIEKENVSLIVDIGCGSGEFVDFARELGYEALGYDPVNSRTEDFFFDEYFQPGTTRLPKQFDSSNVMFVMRCVLPHIGDPFDFLKSIFASFQNAKVLLEFQNLEWILKYKIWYQFSHDHVNYFSTQSFESEFTVKSKGEFANQEWSYCLIEEKAGGKEISKSEDHDLAIQISELFRTRENQLVTLTDHNFPLAIYGAAGKGIVFGFALQQFGAKKIVAIDSSTDRQGRFMEVSGIPILSPEIFTSRSAEFSSVLVMNPAHLVFAKSKISTSIKFISAANEGFL